ncbi:MAG: hypothetical protein NTV23_02595 [Propionibacteriales bacterium]|nr:hypothetical protein [Propionibacteriales bacterium]
MTEILSTATVIVLLLAAFAGLLVWTRHDTLTTTRYRRPELPDRPARTPEPRRAPSIRAGVLRLS